MSRAQEATGHHPKTYGGHKRRHRRRKALRAWLSGSEGPPPPTSLSLGLGLLLPLDQVERRTQGQTVTLVAAGFMELRPDTGLVLGPAPQPTSSWSESRLNRHQPSPLWPHTVPLE